MICGGTYSNHGQTQRHPSKARTTPIASLSREGNPVGASLIYGALLCENGNRRQESGSRTASHHSILLNLFVVEFHTEAGFLWDCSIAILR